MFLNNALILFRYSGAPLSATWLKKISGGDTSDQELSPEMDNRHFAQDHEERSITIPLSYRLDEKEINVFQWELNRIAGLAGK